MATFVIPPFCRDCMDTGYQPFGLNASVPCRNPQHALPTCALPDCKYAVARKGLYCGWHV